MTLDELVAQPGPVRVYLDANVLIPNYLRMAVLELAEAEELSVHWSTEVLREVRRNLVRPEGYALEPAKVDRMLRQLAAGFPDAKVAVRKRDAAQFKGKTDPKDEHVAAGALNLSRDMFEGAPVVLITFNTRDLPQAAFEATPVLVANPDKFLSALLRARPCVADRLLALCQSWTIRQMTPEDLLALLDRAGCSEFTDTLAHAWGFDVVEAADQALPWQPKGATTSQDSLPEPAVPLGMAAPAATPPTKGASAA